jgi:lipopolysaccharide transport system ATP-binding protein
MIDVVIRAERLGKKYLIGHETRRERYRSLRDVLVRTGQDFLHSARSISRGRELVAGDEVEEFWALKDVSFEINRGEAVGIIGRNGAGKSTLLKILSRVTEPSAGRVEIRGRVASLLEVGTGFHPELSGRENIYLNGAVLGMTRSEIRRKFDEIVAFAEVEKFLDSPVKRYSSGMYMRLAFSVAAHLEPEILVVDEVLAVGDAEFQKKCLGKMQDVTAHDRTVLFVSHNIAAIRAMCPRAILLGNGMVSFAGETSSALDRYLGTGVSNEKLDLSLIRQRTGSGKLRFVDYTLMDSSRKTINSLVTAQSNYIRLTVKGAKDIKDGRIGITFHNKYGEIVFNCASDASVTTPFKITDGSIMTCHIPKLPLSGGDYRMSLFLEREGVIEDFIRAAVPISVTDASFFGTSRNTPPGWEARTVLVVHSWTIGTAGEQGPAAAIR